MSKKLSLVPVGIHRLRITTVQKTKKGEDQFVFEIEGKSHRPIWRTFKAKTQLYTFLSKLADHEVSRVTDKQLQLLVGEVVTGKVKHGSNPNFMNLTDHVQGNSDLALIINSWNPVIDLKSNASDEQKKERPNDRQTISDLSK
jgi:hypothetical protein